MMSDVAQSAQQAMAESIATKSAYLTSSGMVVMGLPLSDWASITAIVMGVGGFVLTYATSLYFKAKRDAREERLAARGLLPPTEEAGADDGD